MVRHHEGPRANKVDETAQKCFRRHVIDVAVAITFCMSDMTLILSDIAALMSDVAFHLSDIAFHLSDVTFPMSDIAFHLRDIAFHSHCGQSFLNLLPLLVDDIHGVGVVDEVEDGAAHVVPDQVVLLVDDVITAFAEN